MKTITKTLLRKVLKDVVPDPKVPGPFRVIADVGNTGYYEQRAIEAIHSRDRRLAIQLLILAEATVALESSGSMDGGSGNGQGDPIYDPSKEEVRSLR